jgi:hypothetical protein
MASGGYGKASSMKAFAKALKRQKIAVNGENVTGWRVEITI